MLPYCQQIYSFSFQLSGFQVPLEFNRPVSGSDRTPDDHDYCSHCCSLNSTHDDFNIYAQNLHVPVNLLCLSCHSCNILFIRGVEFMVRDTVEG